MDFGELMPIVIWAAMQSQDHPCRFFISETKTGPQFWAFLIISKPSGEHEPYNVPQRIQAQILIDCQVKQQCLC